MPEKKTGIVGRHPAEMRVKVEANFNGYCHPFGVTVKKGEEYDFSHPIVLKYNKELKTKDGKAPFTIKGKPEKCHDDSVPGINLGSTPELGKVDEPKGMTLGNQKAKEKELEKKEKDLEKREAEIEKKEGKKKGKDDEKDDKKE